MINQVFGAIAALGSAEAQNLLALAGENVLKKYQDSHAWEKLLVNTGEFFLNFEQEATDFFKDLALALSKENMVQIAKDLQTDDGYGLQHKLYDSLILSIPHKAKISQVHMSLIIEKVIRLDIPMGITQAV